LAALILLSALKGADLQLLPSSFRAMEHEMGLRPHMLGLMALCQGVACAVTGPIWGNLVDSGASRKLLLKAGTGLWGLCTLQLAFTSEVWEMMLLRVFNGAALSMLWPVVQSFIADLTTSKNVGQVCGKVYAAANFGQVLTCLIVVPISEQYVMGAMGWRWAMGVVGAFSLLVVLVVELAVEELPRNWDWRRFGILCEIRKLVSFFQIGTFRVIVLQGVFGTIPAAAQSFTTMYFQYLSINNNMCGLITAIRTVGEGIGGALGDIWVMLQIQSAPSMARLVWRCSLSLQAVRSFTLSTWLFHVKLVLESSLWAFSSPWACSLAGRSPVVCSQW